MKTYTTDELKALSAVDYANDRNAETRTRAKLEEWQFYTLLPEGQEYYDRNNCKTAYDVELMHAKSELSDTFKEINNFRPRGLYDFDNMTLDDVRYEIDRLVKNESDRQDEEDARLAAYTDGKNLTYNPFAAVLGR